MRQRYEYKFVRLEQSGGWITGGLPSASTPPASTPNELLINHLTLHVSASGRCMFRPSSTADSK